MYGNEMGYVGPYHLEGLGQQGQGVRQMLASLTPEQKRLAVIAGAGAILITASSAVRTGLTLFGAWALYRQYGREMHEAAGFAVEQVEEYIEVDESYAPEF